MSKVIDGGKLEFGKPRVIELEATYGYYSRCQAVKADGEQCKAPAMKEQDVCRKHTDRLKKVDRMARQRREFLASLGGNWDGKDLSCILRDPKTVQKVLGKIMQAIIDDSLDEDVAGAMLDEIALSQGLLKRF